MALKKSQFKQYGKTKQFIIDHANHLKDVLTLEDAYWVAINAPVKAFNCDADYLAYLDSDHDGCIRSDEVKNAIAWLFEHIQDINQIIPNNTSLPIHTINRQAAQGESIYQTAIHILRVFGLHENDYVTLDHVRKLKQKQSNEETKDLPSINNLIVIEKLILYQANMIQFANSYVSFPDLYNPNTNALFELGTLIIDGRHFTLSVRVLDQERHITFCQTSKMFVLYVNVSERKGGDSFKIAVPVTAGMRGNLQVNKIGIFRDIYGKTFHAEIVKIVENPISFMEAISSPFIRLGNALKTKLDDMASRADEKLETVSTDAFSGQATPYIPRNNSFQNNSMLAGGAVAIAALSSSIAFITKIISGLTIYSILNALVGIISLIFIPICIIAYIKLSNRDLSAIFEGSGWGINPRMRLTYRLAKTFTKFPSLSKKKQLHHKPHININK